MSIALAPRNTLRQHSQYRALKELVVASTGLAYYLEHDEELAARVQNRMAALQIVDCADYLALLRCKRSDESELDRLTEQLTIGETYFFRHQEAFDALREVVLPDAIRRNQARRRLRIWSAGCSIGAEAYSLSILLKRDLAHLVNGWDISILGTDINRDYLATARAGRFERWAMRSMPQPIRETCFESRDASWQLKPEYQTGVSFQYHNLAKHSAPSLLNNVFAFDLILCRNVMIYFDRDNARRIVDHCRECLVDGGWLMVGHAESNMEWYREFRSIQAAGVALYQKVESSSDVGLSTAGPLVPAMQRPMSLKNPRSSTTPRSTGTVRSQLPLPRLPVPSKPTALAEIRSWADQGDLESATRGCEELLRTDASIPAVHFYQSLLFDLMNRTRDAEAALERALRLNPDYLVAHYYLGLILRKQGLQRRAAQSFRDLMLRLAPLDPHQSVVDADELTVADLKQLTGVHLEELSAV